MVVGNRFSESENRLSTALFCFKDSAYSVKAPNTTVNSLRSALPSAVFLEGGASATPSFSPASLSTLPHPMPLGRILPFETCPTAGQTAPVALMRAGCPLALEKPTQGDTVAHSGATSA